ncbi:hypothetical protein [Chryseobacterium mucoviscidosis]|uniref:hypothetical protein n=1 Tax=Chryseobacterium mucoviscidosis TaxID=1945581 RepID=UPI00301679CA
MKKHNPNTKYGRRKAREDFNRRYNNMSEKERSSFDFNVGCAKFVLFIVAMIICLICVAMGISIK